MGNTKTWNDPDTQINNTGPSVTGVYLVDPTTDKAISPAAAGGGGTVTIADGADVALGTTTDAANANTVIGKLKQAVVDLAALVAGITVSNFPATQPISASSLPLPTGAAQENGNLLTIATDMAELLTDTDNLATIQTNTANIPAKGQSTMANSTPVTLASDQSDVPIKRDRLEVSVSSVTNAAILTQDVSIYNFISIHVTQIANNATLTFQASNDNFATQVENVNMARVSSSSSIVATATTTGMWVAPANFRYFRVLQSGATASTTNITAEFFTNPSSNMQMNSVQGGTWTVQPGNTPNTTPWLTSLQGATTTFISSGTSTNTVIKGTPGTFYGIFASTVGAGGGLVYDNATTNSGTPVGSAPSAIGFDQGVPAQGISCVNGITVAGSATNPALTVFWR